MVKGWKYPTNFRKKKKMPPLTIFIQHRIGSLTNSTQKKKKKKKKEMKTIQIGKEEVKCATISTQNLWEVMNDFCMIAQKYTEIFCFLTLIMKYQKEKIKHAI